MIVAQVRHAQLMMVQLPQTKYVRVALLLIVPSVNFATNLKIDVKRIHIVNTLKVSQKIKSQCALVVQMIVQQITGCTAIWLQKHVAISRVVKIIKAFSQIRAYVNVDTFNAILNMGFIVMKINHCVHILPILFCHI